MAKRRLNCSKFFLKRYLKRGEVSYNILKGERNGFQALS